jgi:hypothetical protein
LCTGDKLYVIDHLGEIDVESSRQILRDILKGKTIGGLEPTSNDSAQGIYSYMPYRHNISYNAQAALSLARLKDGQSIPFIKELRSRAEPNEVGIYNIALNLYEHSGHH